MEIIFSSVEGKKINMADGSLSKELQMLMTFLVID